MEIMNHSIYSMRFHSHNGWSEAEDNELFEEVKKARESGKPLRAAFDRISALTGRKSNSIRNYYYMRIRDEEICKRYEPYKVTSFVPFEDEDVKKMLIRILGDQAKGISVRASTMAMGEGDTTAMLRFQNKYRSLLRTNPALIKSVIAEMKESGLPAFDPYEDKPERNLGRPRKTQQSNNLTDVMAQTINDLYNVEGLDVHALFESMGALALSAGKGAIAIKQLEEYNSTSNSDISSLREENAELKAKLNEQYTELKEQKAQLMSLMSSFRRLISASPMDVTTQV